MAAMSISPGRGIGVAGGVSMIFLRSMISPRPPSDMRPGGTLGAVIGILKGWGDAHATPGGWAVPGPSQASRIGPGAGSTAAPNLSAHHLAFEPLAVE